MLQAVIKQYNNGVTGQNDQNVTVQMIVVIHMWHPRAAHIGNVCAVSLKCMSYTQLSSKSKLRKQQITKHH